MMSKSLTSKEKQFTILPNEEDPKESFAKASQAISKHYQKYKELEIANLSQLIHNND